jgi:hypothetical protein
VPVAQQCQCDQEVHDHHVGGAEGRGDSRGSAASDRLMEAGERRVVILVEQFRHTEQVVHLQHRDGRHDHPCRHGSGEAQQDLPHGRDRLAKEPVEGEVLPEDNRIEEVVGRDRQAADVAPDEGQQRSEDGQQEQRHIEGVAAGPQAVAGEDASRHPQCQGRDQQHEQQLVRPQQGHRVAAGDADDEGIGEEEEVGAEGRSQGDHHDDRQREQHDQRHAAEHRHGQTGEHRSDRRGRDVPLPIGGGACRRRRAGVGQAQHGGLPAGSARQPGVCSAAGKTVRRCSTAASAGEPHSHCKSR